MIYLSTLIVPGLVVAVLWILVWADICRTPPRPPMLKREKR
jgi:hypothetical protein